MFEREWRKEQERLQELDSRVGQITARYETRLRDLKKQFDAVKGMAEKEIDAMLSDFERNIDAMLTSAGEQMDRALRVAKDSISAQEADALRYLDEYREHCRKEYLQACRAAAAVTGVL